MPTIVHFEIPFDDLERVKNFYTQLFDWKIEPYEGSAEYWMIKTTGEHPVDGGMMKRQHPQHPITNYVDVPSLEDSAKKVAALNGKILVPKTPVPKMGYFAVCQDTENNIFGLWETDPNAGVFRNEAEVFVAVLSSVIASDEKYSVDEMRATWNEIQQFDILKGHAYHDVESQVLGYFKRKPSDPKPFTDMEMDMILTSARQMLTPKQREELYKAALKLAHADKTVQGYQKDIDEREQKLLQQIQKGLEISQQTAIKINEEIKPKL